MKKTVFILSVILICALLFGACSPSVESAASVSPEPTETLSAAPTPTPSATPTPTPTPSPSPSGEIADDIEYIQVYDMLLPIDNYVEITENEDSTQIQLTDSMPLKIITILEPKETSANVDIILDNMDYYFSQTWGNKDAAVLINNVTTPAGDVEAHYIDFAFIADHDNYFGAEVMFLRDGKLYDMNYLVDNYDQDIKIEREYITNLLENIQFE